MIRRRLSDQRGLTLIEVLLSSVLSLLVMGASLAAFDGLQGSHKLTQKANDAQDVARQQTDRLARELRNLASPSQLTSDLSAQPQAVDVATAYDFVFRFF
jgi:Tfp pilus assembly protein PilW